MFPEPRILFSQYLYSISYNKVLICHLNSFLLRKKIVKGEFYSVTIRPDPGCFSETVSDPFFS